MHEVRELIASARARCLVAHARGGRFYARYDILCAMAKKLIIANWKMNPASLTDAVSLAKKEALLAKKAKNAEVVICPPAVYLTHIANSKSHIALGAQDVSYEEKGAHTGEISPTMLKNMGVRYVIIGHSERRALGETDALIAKKIAQSLRDGLIPILCVGEPLSVRSKGIATAKKFVASQLRKDLRLVQGLKIVNWKLSSQGGSASGGKIVLAYEPIWSISTNKNAKPDSPESASEMIAFIRTHLKASAKGGSASGGQSSKLKATILYGGSVNAKNAKSFLARKEIDGALVGAASLDAKQFAQILSAGM
jgi:triosephosphate isomerase